MYRFISKFCFFVILTGAISLAKIPASFFLISKVNEPKLSRINSDTSVIDYNYTAKCSVTKNICSLTRTNIVTKMEYADGVETFKITKSYVDSIYIIKRNNCDRNYCYILDFNKNIFLGGYIYLNIDVISINGVFRTEKGIIRPDPKNSTYIDIFEEEPCY